MWRPSAEMARGGLVAGECVSAVSLDEFVCCFFGLLAQKTKGRRSAAVPALVVVPVKPNPACALRRMAAKNPLRTMAQGFAHRIFFLIQRSCSAIFTFNDHSIKASVLQSSVQVEQNHPARGFEAMSR